MVTYPLPFGRYRPFFTEGVTLALVGNQFSDSGDLRPPVVKHRNRLHWHIADRVVNDPSSAVYRPGAVPAVFDGRGSGDTGIGAILWVSGGTVCRPLSDTVLASISVKVVGELCAAVGIPFKESSLNMEGLCCQLRPGEERTHVSGTTEVMLAGTGFCLAGVREFGIGPPDPWFSRQYAWPGPVFRKLLAAWSDLVGVDIERQFVEQAP
jgi:branched-chain amino acid aminotransferase